MAESWASTSVAQPESRARDSGEVALLPQELSQPHTSSPDVIQLWQEEVGLLQRVESVEEVEMDLKSSWLSDKELTEMRVEFDARASPVLSLVESDLEPPEAVELLMCVEEPEVEDMMEGVPQTTFTPATPLPESPDFNSVSDLLHHLPCPQELPLPALLSAPGSLAASKHEWAHTSSVRQECVASPAEESPLPAKPQPPAPTTPPASTTPPAPTTPLALTSSPALTPPSAPTALTPPPSPIPPPATTPPSAHAELPVLLISSAALATVVIITTYIWTRK